MGSRHFETEGLVVRTYDFGETDRIIVLLTPNDGIIRCVAKGVRRPGSRFGGALELHALVRVDLTQGANLAFINQTLLIRPHVHIARDWVRATCAATMAEAVGLVGQEGQRDFPLFKGHLDVLDLLDHGPTYPVNIVDAALLRLCASQGVAPSISECAQGDQLPVVGFSVAHGGAVCARHLPGEFARLEHDELATLRILGAGDWATISDTYLPPKPGQLIYRWTTAHLHITLKSWSVIPRDPNMT
ncbi:DNA repair protein RecO [Stomatohabitans albus]|uniref:DNA repair protein RecO n=1 Tax=Stomatohabitans albus TaxID=3110766 RepID=UPI00300BFCCA